jgi:hypothetical protein
MALWVTDPSAPRLQVHGKGTEGGRERADQEMHSVALPVCGLAGGLLGEQVDKSTCSTCSGTRVRCPLAPYALRKYSNSSTK